MDHLRVLLEILELDYETSPVRVMVLKDLGRLSVDGIELLLEKGTETEIPRWLARVLREAGVVEIVESGLTLEDIARAHFSVHAARSPKDMPHLPKNFYQQAREYLQELETRVRRELNPALLEEKQRAEMYVSEVASKRLSLMLQVVRSTAALMEIYEKLAPEEKAVLDALRRILDVWAERVLPRG